MPLHVCRGQKTTYRIISRFCFYVFFSNGTQAAIITCTHQTIFQDLLDGLGISFSTSRFLLYLICNKDGDSIFFSYLILDSAHDRTSGWKFNLGTCKHNFYEETGHERIQRPLLLR